MPEPVPRSGGFVHLYPACRPEGVELVHKMAYGHVDIQFKRMANRLPDINAAFRQHLLPGMTVEKAGGAAAIRTTVPQLLIELDFAPQADNVRKCLTATKQVVAWLTQHGGSWPPKTAATS
jgi:hypothetical protein